MWIARAAGTVGTVRYHNLVGPFIDWPCRPGRAARLKVRIFFQPNVVLNLVSRFKIVVRFRARAAYLFSYGISRAEFSLGNIAI